MIEKKVKRLIVVLGMHRSGTSALTRGLKVMGVSLGERMMPPVEGNNAKGFWEDVDLNALNIEMLKSIGSDWSYLAPVEECHVEKLRSEGYTLRAVELLREKICDMQIFGFKDPRVVKLLPFWKEVFRHCSLDVSYALVVRHPLSVVKSLAQRDGFVAEHSYLMWLGHVLESLTGSQGELRVLVDYDHLMQAPDAELARLANTLNLTIDSSELKKYKTDFLDNELRHTVYEEKDLLLDSPCPPIVREIYSALLDLSTRELSLESEFLRSEISRWSNEYLRLKAPLVLADKFFSKNIKAVREITEREGQIAGLNQALMERDSQIAGLNQALMERDSQIAGLNQALMERDKQMAGLNQALMERDNQIAGLNQAVIERDVQIAGLNEALTERDSQIASLNWAVIDQDKLHQQTLSHIWNSTSWRLTKPLRSLGINSKRLIHIIKILPLAIQHGSGVKNTVSKAFRIYKNEGIDGVRRVLASLRHRAPPRYVMPKDHSSEVPQRAAEIPRIVFDETFNRFVGYKKNPPISPSVKLIAFYLPQFHPFPENDEWWGKGFTEWTNVGKAQPNYIGHYQPHCPIHNGYYDLRVPEVMEEQARLAKEYGVYGFSYYFYWFDGKILMDTPLEMMLANKNVDIPFCFTWANENWSRRWDGQENDILIAQNHSDKDSLAFIRHLIKYFKDDRYICIEGKPLLIIYRANIIPDMAGTAKLWRDELSKHGFPGLYLVSAQSFGIRSPDPFDFDASVEFPPHTVISSDVTSELDLSNPDFCGHVYSYEQVAASAVVSQEPDYKLFRTAMLSWDNTARKQNSSHIFHGFSLLRYKQWLSSIASKVNSNDKYGADEKIVFVNAWNEWAEGTHLEPDQKFGYGYLQTTYDVLRDCDSVISKEQFRSYAYDKRSECAVIVHVHYIELWESISKYLTRSFDGINFDLLVTVTSSETFKKVLADFPLAHVELVENRGRDILPFKRMLNVIKGLDYTAVCKIHSKRSIYRDDGDKIRDEILDALIGSKEQVDDILSRFKDDSKLGMVAPKKYLIKHNDHNMTFDKELVQNVAREINIDFQYDVFPAGSMFWFSPESLSPLLKLDDRFFEIESGLADGTCAHAVERLFCQIVRSGDFAIDGCEFKDFAVSVSA